MLKSIDLFSGIGGFSLALLPVCRPVLFCDKDARSRNVLRAAMREGVFPWVPIEEEVHDLRRCALGKKASVDVICAGFPCQDVSVMNRTGQGVFGTRSSVVREVFRVAQEFRASVIVLENSPNIQHRGLHVIERVAAEAGFEEQAWGVFSASDIGAPHDRKRFYMIACRRGKEGILRHMRDKLLRSDDDFGIDAKYWKRNKPPPRVVRSCEQSLSNTKHRGFLLGNSLVPACARHACTVLLTSLVREIKHPSPPVTISSRTRIEMLVPLDKIIPPHGRQRYIRDSWSTPLASRWRPTRIGGMRATRILPNQIMYERKTQDYMKSRGRPELESWTVNPEFVEWMMGYPIGWTVCYT